jgi:hypothetical protein
VGSVFASVIAPVVNAITSKIESWRKSTDFFRTLETQLTALREKAADIWAAVTEGGEGGNLAKALGQIIKGAFQLAVHAAVALFLKAAPIIGEAIGKAIKGAMDLGGGWLGERSIAEANVRNRLIQEHGPVQGRAMWAAGGQIRYKSEIDAEQNRIHQMNLEAEGAKLSQDYTARFGAEAATGIGGINDIAAKGAEIRAGAQNLEAAASSLDQATEVFDSYVRALETLNTRVNTLESQIKYGPVG